MMRRLGRLTIALLLGMISFDAPASPSPKGASTLSPLLTDQLCVTLGKLSSDATGLTVDGPKMRAVATRMTDPAAEVAFTYVGATQETALLGSGRFRRQIGLKLRAQDSCNVIYVMWRLDPVPGIVVSVKRNPGMSTHAECHNGGYQDLKPSHSAPAPRVAQASAHTLRASIEGDALQVWADGSLVWEGKLGEKAKGLEGPVGIRTDNGRFHFALKSGAPSGPPASTACRQSADD